MYVVVEVNLRQYKSNIFMTVSKREPVIDKRD
jgi:hypothetical protein